MQPASQRPTQTLALCLLFAAAALGWTLASAARESLQVFTGL